MDELTFRQVAVGMARGMPGGLWLVVALWVVALVGIGLPLWALLAGKI